MASIRTPFGERCEAIQQQIHTPGVVGIHGVDIGRL
jgi:hypothetical protein